ncbi:unnamed protein product, partial [marine sediment metagenome]
RADDELFEKFGQVYMTTAYPGVVKAWHYHKLQTDNMAVIRGMMKIVIYDARKDSPTHSEVNEFFLGEHNFKLIQIPKMVYHGFKCIGQEEAIVINIPTKTYNYKNPDEYRVDPYENNIPYDWRLKEG